MGINIYIYMGKIYKYINIWDKIYGIKYMGRYK